MSSIIINSAALLPMDEGGGTTTFTVSLGVEPTHPVILTVSSSDSGEATVDPAALIFQTDDWNIPQTVTLTGADDSAVDGDQASTITVKVLFSNDSRYATLMAETVDVTTIDDEVAGFTLSQTTAVVGEDGTTDTLTVSLTDQPTSNVGFTVSSNNTEDVTASRTTLTFTPENWDEAQSITLAGVDDAIVDGDQSSTVTISVDDANSDDAFDGLADQTVTVTTTDDDTAGFSLSTTSTTVSEDGTTTETVTLTLDAEPTSSVTLNIATGNPAEVGISENTVTLDNTNWDTGVTVTLTGVDEMIADGDQSSTVTVSVDAANSDDAFDNLANQTITVTTTDDETPGFSLSQTSATVSEDGDTTSSITLTLDAEPVTDVVLKIAGADASEVIVSTSTVTLNSGNWNTGVDVILSGIEDQVVDGDQSTTVSVSVDAANSDDAFDNAATQDISVNTIDSMECFLTGTHILTDRGEAAVETLQIGDRVLTLDGTYESIKWVGRQTIDPNYVKYPMRGYPILIKEGALGNHSPHRDLYVSPDHAILVDDLLINAGALVNGRSILTTEPTETFTYYHIQLNQHLLLLVEGTATESYLPQSDDRSWYDNGDEYADLYPDNSLHTYWPMKYARVSSKRQLPRFVSQQLEQRANALFDADVAVG